jgi:hypothetical protein
MNTLETYQGGPLATSPLGSEAHVVRVNVASYLAGLRRAHMLRAWGGEGVWCEVTNDRED